MPKTKKKRTIKTGRPSAYKSEYCQMLIEHMKQGLSIESFAGVVGVNRDTLYQWNKVHPEFSDTLKRGTDLSLLFYEKFGVAIMAGKVDRANVTAWIFNMKNRFKWRDVQPTDQTHTDKAIEESFAAALADIKKNKF